MDAYKPLYNDSQVKEMDEKYGEAVGPGGAVPFEMDKLGEGAQNEGWTMNDEYDAPTEEYGDDRADADKVGPLACLPGSARAPAGGVIRRLWAPLGRPVCSGMDYCAV